MSVPTMPTPTMPTTPTTPTRTTPTRTTPTRTTPTRTTPTRTTPTRTTPTRTTPTPDRPRPVPATVPPAGIGALDERVRALLRRRGPDLMRWALGLVFVWFGALKVANVTPVAALVADTLSFVPLPSAVLLPALGVFEIVAGVALAAGRMLRPVLVLLVGHLVGTFLVLVTQSHVAFQDGNPFLLTTEGEFVVKNLVLIAGALLVAAALPPLRSSRSGRRG